MLQVQQLEAFLFLQQTKSPKSPGSRMTMMAGINRTSRFDTLSLCQPSLRERFLYRCEGTM